MDRWMSKLIERQQIMYFQFQIEWYAAAVSVSKS